MSAPQVLLIHGLGRTSWSLLALEAQLQRLGCVTEQFGYWAVAESFDRIVDRLRVRLQTLNQRGTYGIVAHSLGGLLTRAALKDHPIGGPQHVVMLGTPNRPPRLAPHAWKFLPFQWFTGQCGFNLTRPDFFARLPGLAVPYTIVAGTSGPRGPWSPFGEDINDGIVALEETRLSAMDQLVPLPVEHTFMMNDPQVQTIVFKALGLASE
jgi:pimeloyl-ACP methyl ester carboxylesterase